MSASDPSPTVNGEVTDARQCRPLEGVEVSVVTSDGSTETIARSDARGHWSARRSASAGKFIFSRPGYVRKTVDLVSLHGPVRLLKNELVAYQDTVGGHAGDRVKVFVHAPHEYRATLIRYGLECERVKYLGTRPPVRQTVPNGHFVADGLGWHTSFSYEIPSTAGGLYGLMLKDSLDDRTIVIPLVVSQASMAAAPQSASRLLVLASTNNWHTYNSWGGRSRYRNFETATPSAQFLSPAGRAVRTVREWASRLLPRALKRWLRNLTGTGPPGWKFEPLSKHRPLLHCGLEESDPHKPFTNHLAAGEWRVLAWLEREGFEYDLVTGRQLLEAPEILDGYPALVLSTHCEYWSCDMFQTVRKRHENEGLWIVNLGGNSMYREVEFPDDDAIRCTSLRLSKTCGNELEVIGVRFSMEDYGTCAPYRVIRKGHWIFQGAPLSEDGVFGKESLNRETRSGPSSSYQGGRPGLEKGLNGSGASGWETDKIRRSTPDAFTVVARGMNPGGGADMVVREPSGNRGGVFSASSITYGGALLIDPVISCITANVLVRATGRDPVNAA